jgi:hypothetical protein
MIPAIDSMDAIIASVINNHMDLTIEQLLENHLDGIPRTKRLQQVQDLLLAISEVDSMVAEIASKVWAYIMTHKLWEPKYSSLEAFKESIAYEVTFHEILKRYGTLAKRQQVDARSILANWESLPFDTLPEDLHPPKFSRDLLQFLSRLGKICPLDKAVVLLKEQVFQRYSALHSTKVKPYLIAADVTHVYQDLQFQMVSEDNRLKENRSRYV